MKDFFIKLFSLRRRQFRSSVSLLRTSTFRLPSSDFRLRSSDFRLPSSVFRLPTSVFGLLTPVLLLLLASSCVPVKKITYLQKDDLKGQNPMDSIMRTYELKKEAYTLKPGDIISLRIASITKDEYNFIKKYESELGIIRKLNQYDNGSNMGGNNSNNNLNRNFLGGADGSLNSLSLDRQNTGFVLDKNGELDLPQIGTVQLGGMTISEAETNLKQQFEGYYETPMVRIQILNFNYTILGEVEQEGRYLSYDPELNILDAISISGNLSEFADRSNIKIIRKEGGEAKIIYLNLLDESTLNAENYFVKKDDLIIVPALNARTSQQYTLPNIGRTISIVSAVLSLTAIIISLNN